MEYFANLPLATPFLQFPYLLSIRCCSCPVLYPIKKISSLLLISSSLLVEIPKLDLYSISPTLHGKTLFLICSDQDLVMVILNLAASSYFLSSFQLCFSENESAHTCRQIFSSFIYNSPVFLNASKNSPFLLVDNNP